MQCARSHHLLKAKILYIMNCANRTSLREYGASPNKSWKDTGNTSKYIKVQKHFGRVLSKNITVPNCTLQELILLIYDYAFKEISAGQNFLFHVSLLCCHGFILLHCLGFVDLSLSMTCLVNCIMFQVLLQHVIMYYFNEGCHEYSLYLQC